MSIQQKHNLLIVRIRFLKNDLKMVKEIISEAEQEFVKKLTNIHAPSPNNLTPPPPSASPTSLPSDNSTIPPHPLPNKPQRSELLKGVFRKIASKIHPDKLENKSDFEKNIKLGMYEKARKALEDGDYCDIMEVASEIGLEIPPPSTAEVKIMKKMVQKLEKKIKNSKNSIAWVWHHADEKDRERIMEKYIEKLKKYNSGA